MTFSLSQSLLKLAENCAYGAAFPFEKPEQVPKADDLSLSCSVHIGPLGATPNVNEKGTNRKPLAFGATGEEDH